VLGKGIEVVHLAALGYAVGLGLLDVSLFVPGLVPMMAIL